MGLSLPLAPALEWNPFTEVLRKLYAEQLAESGDDPYLRQHSDQNFIAGQVRVFQWYRPFLPHAGRLLDWGCRHAPDSCLIRTDLESQFQQHACDLPPAGQYGVFHRYAGVEYRQLSDAVRLPYEDGQFNAVIASGVLEHVAMDYESLKELYRVMQVGGRLVLAYLPNRLSLGEWRMRRTGQLAHRRLYSPRLIRELLLRTGFYPKSVGYQTKFDQLPPTTPAVRRLKPAVKLLQAHRAASCLCIIATKVDCM